MPKPTAPRATVSTPCLTALRSVCSPLKDAASMAAMASSCHRKSRCCWLMARTTGSTAFLVGQHLQAGVVVRSCLVAGLQCIVEGAPSCQGAVPGDGFERAVQVAVDVLREALGGQRQRHGARLGNFVAQGGHASLDGFQRFFFGQGCSATAVATREMPADPSAGLPSTCCVCCKPMPTSSTGQPWSPWPEGAVALLEVAALEARPARHRQVLYG